MTGISHSSAPIAVGAEPQVQPNGGTVMKIALYLSLFGMLGLAIWWAVYAWTSDYGTDAPMSMHGYIAMVLGIVGSLIVGCGLIPARSAPDSISTLLEQVSAYARRYQTPRCF